MQMFVKNKQKEKNLSTGCMYVHVLAHDLYTNDARNAVSSKQFSHIEKIDQHQNGLKCNHKDFLQHNKLQKQAHCPIFIDEEALKKCSLMAELSVQVPAHGLYN